MWPGASLSANTNSETALVFDTTALEDEPVGTHARLFSDLLYDTGQGLCPL